VSEEQKEYAEKLALLLMEMKMLGLEGGVYGGSFCLWPNDIEIERDNDFFESVNEFGIILFTPGINLDGGAGV
jgi:hypothetical protein